MYNYVQKKNRKKQKQFPMQNVAFLEDRLLSSQSEKFSKSPNWLEKSRPSKKVTTLFWSCKQANSGRVPVLQSLSCSWFDFFVEPNIKRLKEGRGGGVWLIETIVKQFENISESNAKKLHLKFFPRKKTYRLLIGRNIYDNRDYVRLKSFHWFYTENWLYGSKKQQ